MSDFADFSPTRRVPRPAYRVILCCGIDLLPHADRIIHRAVTHWVYIVTNHPHGTLYVGVTNDLKRRIWQHKRGASDGFSKKYGLKRLVRFEPFRDIGAAIEREKQIKGWLRRKKIELIRAENPLWDDLSDGWYDPGDDG